MFQWASCAEAGGAATPRATLAVPLAGAEQIYILPTGWRDAPWWNDVQVENVEAILDSVKRTYNVNENRVVLSGVSDGATGLYYMAMRDTTPFASFLPLNGYLMVLSSAALDIRTELFPNNLLNKPFFIVNGGNGQLFKHERRSGRVDLVRTGNVVEADARGVAEFMLLLSPDAFDFAQPVKVVANGRVAFEGTVEKSVATLLKWAARDNDRTMLFGAELRIKVP